MPCLQGRGDSFQRVGGKKGKKERKRKKHCGGKLIREAGTPCLHKPAWLKQSQPKLSERKRRQGTTMGAGCQLSAEHQHKKKPPPHTNKKNKTQHTPTQPKKTPNTTTKTLQKNNPNPKKPPQTKKKKPNKKKPRNRQPQPNSQQHPPQNGEKLSEKTDEREAITVQSEGRSELLHGLLTREKYKHSW